MHHKPKSDYVIDVPGWDYEKRFSYKGWTIGLVDLVDSKIGGMFLHDENGRFRLHAQLKSGAARTTETEQIAKDTVDQMIDGTFPPTTCE